MGTIDWDRIHREQQELKDDIVDANGGLGVDLGRENIPPPVGRPDVPTQYPKGQGVTPVTDASMLDPDFVKLIDTANKQNTLKNIENHAQGGNPRWFDVDRANKNWVDEKQLMSDVTSDMKGSYLSAYNSQELLNLRSRQVTGQASQTEIDRANYLSARRSQWQTPRSLEGFFGEIPGKLSGMAGSLAGDAPNIAKTVGFSVGAGAVIGSAVPGLGTAAGAVGGLKVGASLAFGENMARTSMGEFYEKMLHTKMADGSPIDDKVARGAALVVGGVNGALGVLPLAGAFSKSGIASKIAGPGAAEVLAQYIADPAVAKVLSHVAVSFAAGEGAQAVVGALQSLTNVIGEKAVTQAPLSLDDAHTAIADGAVNGLQIGLVPGGVETALHWPAHRAAYFQNAGEVSRAVFPNNRDQAAQFFDRIAQANNQRNLTLPRDSVMKLLDEVGLEGDGLKAAMPEVHRQLGETENDPKAEIQFKPGELAAYVAPAPGFAEAKGDLRAGPTAMTLNELKKLAREADKTAQPEKPMGVESPAQQPMTGEAIVKKYPWMTPEIAKQLADQTNARGGKVPNTWMSLAEKHDVQWNNQEVAYDKKIMAAPAEEQKGLEAEKTVNQGITRTRMAKLWEQAIKDAPVADPVKRTLAAEPIFQGDDKGGMSDAAHARYVAELDRAIAETPSELEKTLLKRIKEEGLEGVASRSDSVRQELIASDSSHSLVSYLEKGERLDGGTLPLDDSDNFKLDTDDLRKMGLTEGELTQLAKYHDKEGMPVRDVARAFGMTPHDMVQTLKDYTPLDEAVKNKIMNDIPGYVDPVSWLKGRMVEKLSNDVIPKVMEVEYHALGGKGTYEQIRQAAINSLRNVTVGTLNPEDFFREYHRLTAAAKSARAEEVVQLDSGKMSTATAKDKAEYAKLKEEQAQLTRDYPDGNITNPVDASRIKTVTNRMGELEKMHGATGIDSTGGAPTQELSAQELQQRRMMAFERWKFARDLLEKQSKLTALMGEMRDNETMRANLPPEDVKALDSALEAYGFIKPETPQEFPIAAYIEKEKSRPGTDIKEDPELKARATARNDIGQLTAAQLRNADGFLRSLYHHVTVDKPNYFDIDGKPHELEGVISKAVKYVSDMGGPNRADRGAFYQWVTKGIRGAAASLIKAEFLIRHLDRGEEYGLLNRIIWQPLVQAEAREAAWQGAADKMIRDNVDKIYDGSLHGDTDLRVHTKGFIYDPKGTQQFNKTLSKTEVMSALMSSGSALNQKATLEGYGITMSQLTDAAAKHLSSKHLDFINQYWALHEAYFPELAKTYAKRNGVTLESVKPTPFEVTGSDGVKVKMTGGYTPIMYGEDAKYINKAFNVQGYQDPAIHVDDDMTESRNGSYGAVELNLARVLGSLRSKIHYAATYDAVQNVSKVIGHPDFQQAIKDGPGPEFNDTLKNAIRHFARDGMPMQPLSAWDKAVRWVQTGAAQAHVAWNHITAFVQPIFGYLQASAHVDQKYLGKAALDLLSDWSGTLDTSMKESNVLFTMGENPALYKTLQPFDFDVSVPVQNKMMRLGNGKLFQNVMDVKDFLSELGMAHQQNTRQLAGILAYNAAKLQGMAENHPNPVNYADAILRQVIGGTGAKDMPNLLANPSIARGYVNYYSHRALIASEFLERTMTMRSEGMTREQLMKTAKTISCFLVLPTVAVGALRQTYKTAPPGAADHPEVAAGWVSQQLLAALISDVAPGIGDIAASAIEPNLPQGHFGGPIGQMAGDVRSSVLGLLPFDSKHKFNYQAMANVASFMGHVPAGGMTKDLDVLEGVLEGRYDGDKWYDIYARGPKKGRK